jgi:hypothetical protein
MDLIQGRMVLSSVCLSLFDGEGVVTCCNFTLVADRMDAQ